MNISENGETLTTGPGTVQQQPRLMIKEKRAHQNEKQKTNKKKRKTSMKEALGTLAIYYRKRLEPVFPGRLDLRSKRDGITERREKEKTESGRKKEARQCLQGYRVTHPLILLLYHSTAPTARRIRINRISTAATMEAVPANTNIQLGSGPPHHSKSRFFAA